MKNRYSLAVSRVRRLVSNVEFVRWLTHVGIRQATPSVSSTDAASFMQARRMAENWVASIGPVTLLDFLDAHLAEIQPWLCIDFCSKQAPGGAS